VAYFLLKNQAETSDRKETFMNRRTFMGRTGCGLAAFATAAGLADGGGRGRQEGTPVVRSAEAKRRRYKLDIEIFEARTDSWCHKKGDTFSYPADAGKLCPWLLGSLHDFLVALSHGATLPWKYEGTPYEKVIDPDGVTTEYVRCPDPTSNLVAKITRTLV
jgi:uncharacterized repeat protein (TIGR04076 family)